MNPAGFARPLGECSELREFSRHCSMSTAFKALVSKSLLPRFLAQKGYVNHLLHSSAALCCSWFVLEWNLFKNFQTLEKHLLVLLNLVGGFNLELKPPTLKHAVPCFKF